MTFVLKAQAPLPRMRRRRTRARVLARGGGSLWRSPGSGHQNVTGCHAVLAAAGTLSRFLDQHVCRVPPGMRSIHPRKWHLPSGTCQECNIVQSGRGNACCRKRPVERFTATLTTKQTKRAAKLPLLGLGQRNWVSCTNTWKISQNISDSNKTKRKIWCAVPRNVLPSHFRPRGPHSRPA